jgi:hypothetical protein
MADAALSAVEAELHLNGADGSDVTGEPLAPLALPSPAATPAPRAPPAAIPPAPQQ